MSVLVLRLAAPMQSWGDSSRFARRATRPAPTKSGVIGLLAAAQGRRRTDPIEDLLCLRMGVRVDQPGELLEDFQTARDAKGNSMPLSRRHYLCDAIFVVGLEGEETLLRGLADAVRKPVFPLYLGRRSCPPTLPLFMEVREGSLESALSEHGVAWMAADWFKRRHMRAGYTADLYMDGNGRSPEGDDGNVAVQASRDLPLSFSPVHRQYGWRDVHVSQVVLRRADQQHTENKSEHDPFAAWGGV